jgi:pantoate--beta-alanine ligase
MWIARSVDECRRLRADLTGRVAFVPTMGALHEGHLSLMRGARQWADHVVVSIFVNPTQFAPHEDLERYPRPLEDDLRRCEDAGAAGVFCPSVEQMYPPGEPACAITVPALADMLEGEHRPHFFAGVCRVVMKLLNIVRPDVACWGQKDYQQYRVIDALSADLMLPVTHVLLATVREADGLAMSSRNVYLSAEQRTRALGLIKALRLARALVEEQGESDPRAIEDAMRQALEAHRLAVDYAAVRHPRTLAPLDCVEPALTGGVIALTAAHVDQVRLIDNMLLGAPG